MFYIPDEKYFLPQEFFSPFVIEQNSLSGVLLPNIWRLIDNRMLFTVVEIRKFFNKGVYINDYLFGGRNILRGFRSFSEIQSSNFSLTSQHCFGRAIDFNVDDYTSEEIREHIKENYKTKKMYQYIAAIEEEVEWIHIDCRSWNVNKYGLFVC